MPYRRTTLSKFIIEDQRRAADPQPDLTSLLNDIQTACKLIAVAASRGALDRATAVATGEREPRRDLAEIASQIIVETLEWGGQLAGLASVEMDIPSEIPAIYPRGRYLLLVDPLDGADNIAVNMPVGTIFSVLRCPDGIQHPTTDDFLQPGTAQVAAGFAMYGPSTMMILTRGAGVHGFTLDREIGAFMLTHPDMRIPETTREFAVDVTNERFWEPPVQRYVNECIEGTAGPRGQHFQLRWIASLVAEMHRVLLCGGLFMHPGDMRDPARREGLRLLHAANPMAMIIEQAGGAASTGRTRILEIEPGSIGRRVPALIGSRAEVERLAAYHAEHDRGEHPEFRTPLFNARSLFRTG
jgi:fructose-1,6-bisphosphatase